MYRFSLSLSVSLSFSTSLGLYDGENKKVIGKFKDESPDEVIEVSLVSDLNVIHSKLKIM